MESRHARHWRAFVHGLIYPDGESSAAFDGVCFIGLSGAVEFAEGCLAASSSSSSLSSELQQLPALFQRLTDRAVLAERVLNQPSDVTAAYRAPPPPMEPAIRLDGAAFHVVEATPWSARAVARGRARALLALQLRVGVLVLLLRPPASLQRVWARLDAAWADLR